MSVNGNMSTRIGKYYMHELGVQIFFFFRLGSGKVEVVRELYDLVLLRSVAVEVTFHPEF